MPIKIPVAELEFVDGGNTIWVHNAQGATVFRLKVRRVVARPGCDNVCAHADVIALEQDVHFCMPETKQPHKE